EFRGPPQTAAAHRRSVTQEAIHLIETALNAESSTQKSTSEGYWTNRKLLPEFEAALKAGAFSGGTDSAIEISGERSAR
ncbi:MAG: hypothetical protein ABI600_17720, partial [Luteolibacter sp.]